MYKVHFKWGNIKLIIIHIKYYFLFPFVLHVYFLVLFQFFCYNLLYVHLIGGGGGQHMEISGSIHLLCSVFF